LIKYKCSQMVRF